MQRASKGVFPEAQERRAADLATQKAILEPWGLSRSWLSCPNLNCSNAKTAREKPMDKMEDVKQDTNGGSCQMGDSYSLLCPEDEQSPNFIRPSTWGHPHCCFSGPDVTFPNLAKDIVSRCATCTHVNPKGKKKPPREPAPEKTVRSALYRNKIHSFRV